MTTRILAGLCAALLAGSARGDDKPAAKPGDKAAVKAAEELLETMQMKKMLDSSIDTMMDLQIKANPMLEPVKVVMKEFMKKYMSYESLKDEMTALYADNFTADEMKEMTAFYRTKTGKKMLEKTPKLTARGAEMGMKRVQENSKELQEMIKDALEKKDK